MPAREWLPIDEAPDAAPDTAFDHATAEGAAPLPYRIEMEQLFGRSFAGVQAHVGRAGSMAEIDARAASRGQVVAFAEASPSKATVAHELTHTVQNEQAGAVQRAPAGGRDASERAEPAEREADAVAERVASGAPAGPICAMPGRGIQRLMSTFDFKYQTGVVAQQGKLHEMYEGIVKKLDAYHKLIHSPRRVEDGKRINALKKLKEAATALKDHVATDRTHAQLVRGLDQLIGSIDIDLRGLQSPAPPATPIASPSRAPGPRIGLGVPNDLRSAVKQRDDQVIGTQHAQGVVGADHDWTAGAPGVLGKTTNNLQRRNLIEEMLGAGHGDILHDLLRSPEGRLWQAAVFEANAAPVVAACAALPGLLDAIAGRDRRGLDRDLVNDRGAQVAHWTKLLVDNNEIGALLMLAGRHEQWRGAVLGQRLWPRIAAALPSPVRGEQFRGLASLIRGDEPPPLDVPQAKQVFRGLTGGSVADGPRTLRDFPSTGIGWDGPALTDGATPARTWQLEKELVPVTPTEQAMRKMLRSLATLPASALQAVSVVAFVHEFEYLWRQQTPVASTGPRRFATPVRRPLDTSYAHGAVVVLRVTRTGDVPDERIGSSGGGHADSVGGGRKYDADGNPTNAENLTRMSYFENHARHEFGHAVGGTTYAGLPDGNTQATTAGQWLQTDVNAFRTAMWSATGDQEWSPGRAAPARPLPRPPGGPPPVPPRAGIRVSADDACTWMLGVLADGVEPTGSPITAQSLSAQAKLERIARLWSDQELPKYLTAVLKACGGDIASVPSWAFRFPGYTPRDPVHIYCSRWGGYASYSKETWQEMHTKVSWYSLASPFEMFAELFTLKYSRRNAELPVLGSIDWATYFTSLERKAAPPPTAPSPTTLAAGPLQPRESEPPAHLIPTL